MQPYLFPYVGYFQLLAGVDRFVFYDDVNYIKGGWINRNRLFLSGKVAWFTLPLCAASPYKKINEIHVNPDQTWRRKLLASVQQSYRRAPYFEKAYDLLNQVISSKETSLSTLARESVMSVADYLGIATEFVVSSSRYKNENLSAVNRVIDICQQEAAGEYHNLPGGTALYCANTFAEAGIALHFTQSVFNEYRQLSSCFQPGLSILDVLMFNDRNASLKILRN